MANIYRDETMPMNRVCSCGKRYDGKSQSHPLDGGWHLGAKYEVLPVRYGRDGNNYHVTLVTPVAVCPECHAVHAIAKIRREYRADYKGATYGT